MILTDLEISGKKCSRPRLLNLINLNPFLKRVKLRYNLPEANKHSNVHNINRIEEFFL